MSNTGPARTIFEPEHEEFRAFVREFLERKLLLTMNVGKSRVESTKISTRLQQKKALSDFGFLKNMAALALKTFDTTL